MAKTNINYGAFQQTLGASGTQQKVQTDTSIVADGFVIKALAGNTGNIYLGKNLSTLATTGYELTSGESVGVDAISLQNLYFDGSHTGDKICVLWIGN